MSRVDEWLSVIGDRSSGATDDQIKAASHDLQVELPADYRDAMRAVNGGEAEFGESWVRLWPVDELAEQNAGYEVQKFAPGFTYFGTNGGGEAYAWDWRPERKSRYVVIPMIDPNPAVAVPCGETFEEFLSILHGGIPF